MKGATALRKGESPGVFVRVLVKRLPKRVKASKRVFIYDNACNAHKWGLRRYPHRLRNFIFLIDRHHLSNHTSCSKAYDINNYSYLADVNTQKCEQRNRELRKFSARLAKMQFDTYIKWIELWMGYVNLKEKNAIKQPNF